MKVLKTEIRGLLVVKPDIFEDERGYFFESYNEKKFSESGIDIKFVQDNQSKSNYGVIRGLHYQLEPHSQAKLVRVLDGTIYDVAVDLRKGPPTFGKWFGLELSSGNKEQLLIPAGFAHGFSVLSITAVVLYKCDKYYNPGSEGGILYSDPELNVNWKIPPGKTIVSAKDAVLPAFDIAKKRFNFAY